MPTDWMSPCGVGYRLWEDGRIEVQGLGFPAYTAAAQRDVIAKIWSKFGADILAAAKLWSMLPAWIVAIIYIESGGDPRAASPCNNDVCPGAYPGCLSHGYCAGGIMQFIPSTASSYGHTIAWYMDNPGQMIADGANLLRRSMDTRGGDLLTAVKKYNGGASCGGAGVTGHDTAGNYVSKFTKAANAFVEMHLAEPAGAQGLKTLAPGMIVAGVALGGVAYMLADLQWRLTDRLLDAIREAAA